MKLKHFEKFQDTTEALAGTVWWSFANQCNKLETSRVLQIHLWETTLGSLCPTVLSVMYLRNLNET